MSTFRLLSAKKCQETCPDVSTHLEKVTANAHYLKAHQRDLVQHYPNQWVAIADGRVVGHGSDLTQLTKELAEKGFALTEVLIRFMSETQRIFIL